MPPKARFSRAAQYARGPREILPPFVTLSQPAVHRLDVLARAKMTWTLDSRRQPLTEQVPVPVIRQDGHDSLPGVHIPGDLQCREDVCPRCQTAE